MSRHAASIGWRPLQQPPLRQQHATAAIRRLDGPLIKDLSISTTLFGATLQSGARSQHHLSRTKYAVLQRASVRWPRPTAPLISRLGLQKEFTSPQWARPSLVSTFARQQLHGTKRWYSKSKGAVSEGASQATKGANVQPSGRVPNGELSKPVQDADHGGRHLSDYLPHLHRPTKEELLAAATGFWNRVGIRFKWFSIRSMRPYKIDDFHAFFTWILWGHVLWIVLGTTTFVSLAILAFNSIFAQETVAGWIGNYLTQSSGLTVVFESAIVPQWRSGVIEFRNVFVSRRPGVKQGRGVSKGSRETAAAVAAARSAAEKASDEVDPDEDTNYTQFDVNIDSVAVTLSFAKWFNGKGLLRDVEVRGVRGVVDRTSVHWTDEYIDPKSYRHEHNPGDFEIDSFKMEDVLLTVYQPKNFRPFTVSVYNCELPRLRKQWLFYDFLSANNMSGSFDESLFTIHPRQAHGHTGAPLVDGAEVGGMTTHWKKHSRLRIDGLNIDHLNRGVEGPFGWIHEGNVDIVADVMIPDDKDGSIAQVMSDFYDQLEATVTNAQQHGWHKHPDTIIRQEDMDDSDSDAAIASQPQATAAGLWERPDDKRFLILDIHCSLNDVRASVPLFTKDIGYVSNALVRPIVAYINSRRSYIPVNCRVVKRQSEFDGSWTIFDSGLLDDLSKEVYDAFARDVYDQKQRSRRMKKVGLWTLQVVGQALFLGLAGQLA